MELPVDPARAVELVRKSYDEIADQYLAGVVRPGSQHPRCDWLGRLCERLGPSSSVLDLGCGAGVPVSATLDAQGHSVTGIDVSARQIALAKSNVPGAHLVVGDVAAADFPRGAFDAVVMLYVITHVPRDLHGALLGRIHRWLRPGGRFLANFPVSDSPGWLEENFLGYGVCSWTNGWDARTNVALLEEAGFTVEQPPRIAERSEGRSAEEWLWVLARATGEGGPAHRRSVTRGS